MIRRFTYGLIAVGAVTVLLFMVQSHDNESRESGHEDVDMSHDSVHESVDESADDSVLDHSQMNANDWIALWSQSAGSKDEQARVVEMAESERDRIQAMMQENPRQAMEEALPLNDWVRMPEELQMYFPRPFSNVGNVDQLWAVGEGHTHEATDGVCRSCRGYNEVLMNGEKFTAYDVSGSPLPVLINAPIAGVRLGNSLVIDKSPVLRLDEAEIDAAKELYGSNQGNVDPFQGDKADVSGEPALIAGELFFVNDPSDLMNAEELLIAAREEALETRSQVVENPLPWLDTAGGTGGTSGVDTTPYMQNNIRALFIRVDFSDFPGAPVSKSNLEATLSEVARNIEDYSYGAASLDYVVTNNVYRMPRTGSSYARDSGLAGDGIDGNESMHADASAAASAHHVLGNFDVIAVYFPNLGGVEDSLITYAGLASIGLGKQWINGYNQVDLILHEFGHNYGLYHANYHDLTESISGEYEVPGSLEFGDIYDVMGGGARSNLHYSHLAKNYLGWLPNSKVAHATADGTFRIYRFDHINAITNNLLAVRVPVRGDVDYWIGYRQLIKSTSNNLDSSAYVVASNLSQGLETNLIDMTPGSDPNPNLDRLDAGLPLNSPLTVDGGAVTLEAISRGGVEPNQWIDVSVKFASRIGFSQPVVEVDEKQSLVHLEVTRKFGGSGSVSVTYSTSTTGNARSAIPGSDYSESSGTITWADGDVGVKRISIPIYPDSSYEGVEEFFVTLNDPVGAALDAKLKKVKVRILDAGMRLFTFDCPNFNRTVNAIVPLNDGRVIIGGRIPNGIGAVSGIRHIARLHPDGSVDKSFRTGTGFDGQVNGIIKLPDGKLVVVGEFRRYKGRACGRVVRLHPNGDIDNSFRLNTGRGANATVNTVALEEDGSILLGGEFTAFDRSPCQGLVRLRPNGRRAAALNTPFQTNFNTEIHDILVLNNGDMIVGGVFYNPSGGGIQGGCMRLNNDGTRDLGFNTSGGARLGGANGFIGRVHSISKDPGTGGYLLAGRFDNFDGRPVDGVVRVSANGAYDATFKTPAYGVNPLVVLGQASGKVLVGGAFSSPTRALQRLTESGGVDSTFRVGKGFTYNDGSTGYVTVLVEGDDGSVWVGGNFFNYRGMRCAPVIRLAAGDLTPSENTTLNPFNSLTWEENAGEITITGFNGTLSGSLVIPLKINGMRVTSIANGAFDGCIGLTSVTLPMSIQSIGDNAFAGCRNLESIVFMGRAPWDIGESSFDGLSEGAKAFAYSYFMDSFGIEGSSWYSLTLQARANPLPSVRFTRPGNNAKIWRRLITRYRVKNHQWAGKMEVLVRGRGRLRWLSFNNVKYGHTLKREIMERRRNSLKVTRERARVRDLNGRIRHVTVRKFRSKFPWNDKRSKINVYDRF